MSVPRHFFLPSIAFLYRNCFKRAGVLLRKSSYRERGKTAVYVWCGQRPLNLRIRLTVGCMHVLFCLRRNCFFASCDMFSYFVSTSVHCFPFLFACLHQVQGRIALHLCALTIWSPWLFSLCALEYWVTEGFSVSNAPRKCSAHIGCGMMRFDLNVLLYFRRKKRNSGTLTGRSKRDDESLRQRCT